MFAPPIAKAQAKTSASSTSSPARQRSASQAHRLGHGPAEQALTFHRAIGNQGMLRLLAAQRAASLTETPNMPFYPPARMGGSAPPSPVPTPRLPGPIQAKLNVGAVDDPLEHEADRIADQVMHMPAPGLAPTAVSPQISRKCAACEEEEEKLQKKEAGTAEASLSEAPASVHEALRSPGQPLDGATRSYFEPRFGRDFSSVRVHSGPAAAQSARDVNAHAYTVGHNIAFDSGRFAPGSQEGRRLIAHELSHVLQQSGGAMAIQRAPTPGTAAHNSAGPPVIIRIDAYWRSKSATATLSNGNKVPLTLTKNELEPGVTDHTLEYGPDSGPQDSPIVELASATGASSSILWTQPSSYALSPKVRVSIKLRPEESARRRIARLPEFIQDYLYKNVGGEDVEYLADYGEGLVKAGTTKADLAPVEVQDKAPPDPDREFVQAAVKGRYSQFPSFQEFKKDLLRDVAAAKEQARTTSLTPPDPLEGAEWQDDPAAAQETFDKFVFARYDQALKTEAAALRHVGEAEPISRGGIEGPRPKRDDEQAAAVDRFAQRDAEQRRQEAERKQEILKEQHAFAESDPSGCPPLTQAKIDPGPYVDQGLVLPYDVLVPEPDPTKDPSLDEEKKLIDAPTRLEQLYFDASKGNYRAAWFVCQLEAGARVYIGEKWADDLNSLGCTFLYNCGLDTQLPFSKTTASGQRMRSVISEAFEKRAFDIKLARSLIGDVLTLIGGVEIAKAGVAGEGAAPTPAPDTSSATTLGSKDPGYWADTQPATSNPTVGKLSPGQAEVTDIATGRKPPAANAAKDSDVAQQQQVRQAVGQTASPDPQTNPAVTTPRRTPRVRTPKGPRAGEVTLDNIDRVPGMNNVLKRVQGRIEKGGSWNQLGFRDPQSLLDFVNRDPEGAVKELNKTLDRLDIQVESVRDPGKVASADEMSDVPHHVTEAQRKWYREDVLGKTPSKYSQTGQVVRQRMQGEDKLKAVNGREEFLDRRTQKWYPVDGSDIHMGHTKDAVTWWNEKGRYFAPRSPEVRDWMENADHYELEYGPANSAAGARIGAEYLPPVDPAIDTSGWPQPSRGE